MNKRDMMKSMLALAALAASPSLDDKVEDESDIIAAANINPIHIWIFIAESRIIIHRKDGNNTESKMSSLKSGDIFSFINKQEKWITMFDPYSYDEGGFYGVQGMPYTEEALV